jgi:6-phosphogluconolactonase
LNRDSLFYISVADEDRIASARLISERGVVEIVEKIKAPGMPGPICVDAERLLLYIGLRSAHEVAVFRVASRTGALELIDTAPLADEPCYISLDRSRCHLFAAYYRAGGVSVSPLRHGGRVGEMVQWLTTAPHAHCIEFDPTNSFAYVPHVSSSNRIDRLRFDSDAGRLRRTWWSTYRRPRGSGPRHCSFHPRLNLVYFSNEQGNSVSTYRYHGKTGKLHLLDTQSTLPVGWRGENLCADIRLHADARALYVSNRGHDSIAIFRLDRDSGLPTLHCNVKTEPCPRAFNLSDDSSYLLGAGQRSGRLALYRVSGDGVGLEPRQVIEVGANPLCIEPLRPR